MALRGARGAQFLLDDSGRLVGYIDGNGVERNMAGDPITPGSTPLNSGILGRAQTPYGSTASNFGPAFTKAWRLAKAKLRTGAGNIALNWNGDSTTVGLGAGTGGGTDPSMTGAEPRAVSSAVAALFSSMGLPSNHASFWGAKDGATTLAKFQEYDPRILIGAGWVLDTNWLSGPRFRAPAAVTTSFAFTPGITHDRIQVTYFRTPAGGSFTVDIGGAALLTQSTSGSSLTVQTAVINCTRGLNTVNIKSDGAANVFLVGCEVWDSQTPSVLMRNFARVGDTAAGRLALIAAVQGVPGDFNVLNYGTNDMHTGVSASDFQATMQTIIESLTGGILLVMPGPTSAAWAPLSVQRDYAAVYAALANKYNVPLIDLNARFGTYEDANAAGFMYNDPHPNQYGYADNAAAIGNPLLTV